MTSSAVNGAPLWKVTPSRSLYSIVCRSMTFWLSARSQTISSGFSGRIGVLNSLPKTKPSKLIWASWVWLVGSQLPVSGSPEAKISVERACA